MKQKKKQAQNPTKKNILNPGDLKLPKFSELSTWKRKLLQHQKRSRQENDTIFKSVALLHCFWKRCHDFVALIPYTQTIQLLKLNQKKGQNL